MPKVPKWAADAVETLFSGMFRKVIVSDVSYLNSCIKKIRFRADLEDVKFKTGQAIIIRVNDTNSRNYTPSSWNSNEGTFEVIFHIHGNGPGSSYIENLKLNDTLNIGLPRGFDCYKKEYSHHFFFGDETTLGIFESLKHRIEENGQQYAGVLEMNNSTLASETITELSLPVVPISDPKAGPAVAFLESMSETEWQVWKTAMFYLLGNGRSIQNFRKALKSKGISSRNILTQPYWVEGKIGL